MCIIYENFHLIFNNLNYINWSILHHVDRSDIHLPKVYKMHYRNYDNFE